MASTELPKCSIVLAVPNFPPGKVASNCKCNSQHQLKDGTLFSVHLRGKVNNIWFPDSNYGPYCKIIGKIKQSHLLTLIKFLKKYEECKRIVKSESGFCNFRKKLGEGLTCESIGALLEFLTNALAFERWKLHHGSEYNLLNEWNYCEAMHRFEEVREEVWRSMK